MEVEEGGNKEHLSIDVDMNGGMDVKMQRVTLPPTRNVVMVDINEGVDNTIVVVIWVGKTTTFEVVENICFPSSSFKSHLQCMGIHGSIKCYKVKSHK
jgi:hypothetical protein